MNWIVYFVVLYIKLWALVFSKAFNLLSSNPIIWWHFLEQFGMQVSASKISTTIESKKIKIKKNKKPINNIFTLG